MWIIFLSISAFLLLSELLYLWYLWHQELKLLQQDWDEAHSYSSAEEFVSNNKDWLQHVRLGFNLSPETIDWTYRQERPDRYDCVQPSPKQTVAKLINTFGLEVGRVGLRMNRCLDKKLTITLNYYQPWFDELADSATPLYINIGFRVFRWPESHAPRQLLKTLYPGGIPKKGYEVTPETSLGKYLLETYYPQVCEVMLEVAKQHSYPKNFFYCLQPENEALSDFGSLGWKVNQEFLLRAIGIVHRYFPQSLIMQNSPLVAGQFKKVNRVLVTALKSIDSLSGKLLVGINNYYDQPHRKIVSMRIGTRKLFENLAWSKVTKQFFGNISSELEELSKHGIRVMTSEAPMEPWPPYFTPGNDFHDYVFMLLRNKRVITIPTTGVVDVLNWGVEELLFNWGNKNHPQHWHHQEIIRVFQKVKKLRN